MFHLLQVPVRTFQKLPRILRHSFFVLPPLVGHILFIGRATPKLQSAIESPTLLLWSWRDDSVLASLLREIDKVDRSIKAWSDLRQEAIEKESARGFVPLRSPEPVPARVLLQGIANSVTTSHRFLQKRGYHSSIDVEQVDNVAVDIDERIQMFILGRKILQSITNAKEKKIDRALKKCAVLCQVAMEQPEVLAENFHWLKTAGFTTDEVLKFCGLLTVHPEILVGRAEIVSSHFSEFDNLRLVAGILHVETQKLDIMMKRWKTEAETLKTPSRVHWLSGALEVKHRDILDQMDGRSFLMTTRLATLQKKLNFLIGAGVQVQDICGDPWVLNHAEENLKARLSQLQEAGVDPIKPWQLRCSFENLKKCTLITTSVRKAQTIHPDMMEYFKAKLNVSDNAVQKLFAKMPQLQQHTSFERVDELITFLYSEGLTSQEILEFPSMLGFRQENLKDRIMFIRAHGFDVENVPRSYLFGSNSRFEKVVMKQISDATPTPNFRFSRAKM